MLATHNDVGFYATLTISVLSPDMTTTIIFGILSLIFIALGGRRGLNES